MSLVPLLAIFRGSTVPSKKRRPHLPLYHLNAFLHRSWPACRAWQANQLHSHARDLNGRLMQLASFQVGLSSDAFRARKETPVSIVGRSQASPRAYDFPLLATTFNDHFTSIRPASDRMSLMACMRCFTWSQTNEEDYTRCCQHMWPLVPEWVRELFF